MPNKYKNKETKHMSQEWNTLGGHDPTIIKDYENKKYYMFSTDSVLEGQYTSGIQMRVSNDLIHWDYKGTVFNGVPQEAYEWSSAEGLWAPEVIEVGKEYRMYYSASSFGSTTSCICLATAETLEGPWKDQGIVVKTNSSLAAHNAIDANIVTDKENRMWLCYGSFFGGIYLLELNKSTGFPIQKGTYGTCIAKRSTTVEGAIEGPYIIYHPVYDYYYLFSSYDSLFDTYNIRVSRAKEIGGPYIDIKGHSTLDEKIQPDKTGTKILGSYGFENEEEWIAPGHNSLIIDRDTNAYYMVHHVRYKSEKDIEPLAFIRKLRWLENGWPIVSVEYLSEVEKDDTKEFEKTDLLGSWEFVEFDDENSKIVSSQKTEIKKKDLEGLVCFKQNGYCTSNKTYLQIYQGYDWKNKRAGIYLSGLSSRGVAILGKKVES